MKAKNMQTKSIVQVVFNFDVEDLTPSFGAKSYTYFCFGPVKVGDLALAVVNHAGREPAVKGVLVVNTEPSASAIRQATKALLGVVDTAAARKAAEGDRAQAIKEAWERFEGAGRVAAE